MPAPPSDFERNRAGFIAWQKGCDDGRAGKPMWGWEQLYAFLPCYAYYATDRSNWEYAYYNGYRYGASTRKENP